MKPCNTFKAEVKPIETESYIGISKESDFVLNINRINKYMHS